MNDTVINLICSVIVGLSYKYLYAAVTAVITFLRGSK